MILIICESILATKTVAIALGANNETSEGIHTSGTLTVATVPPRFIRHTPLGEMADGKSPFIPEKFRMSVTDKELERELKPLFREASEVVFASDGGADAQARFFNICRHFRVGCPRSRMWMTRLSYGAIRGAFHFRESGRHLHRLAQTGLVSKGMDMLFGYNINQTLLHMGLPACNLTRQEAVALLYLGELSDHIDYVQLPANPAYSILVNANSGTVFESAESWDDEADAGAALESVPTGETVPATLTIEETDRFNLRFHTLLTLQMDAFNNLGFMPGKTLKVAQKLYDRGLISSPLTDCPHLPEKLRGHIMTVFPDAGGYLWGDNGATIDSHAIITLRAADEVLTGSELQLYRLILTRMRAVMEQKPVRKYATLEFTVGDNRFSRRWEITGDAYDVTETGSFQTQVEIADAGVYPFDRPVESRAFADVIGNLTTVAGCVDELMHTGVPYTKETNDYGSATGSLVNKGLAMLDGDEIYLTPEGQAIFDEFFGHEIAELILTWQFEANDLYGGDQTGRSVIGGFSGALLDLIGELDPGCGA